MAGPSPPKHDHDLSDQIVLKAVHDETGWRVQFHIHQDGNCTLLEGHARFTTQDAAHTHGKYLHQAIDVAIGIVVPRVEQDSRAVRN